MAAWNVNDIYVLLRTIVNQNQQAYISPTVLFYTWNSEQRMYQSDLLGRFQNRSNNKTGNNIGLILDETIQTKLTPFTKTLNIAVAAGVANKPSDFIYGLASRVSGKKLEIIDKGQISYVSDSVIDPPSLVANAYYATEYLAYYQVFPDTIASIDIDYVCDVTDVVWGSVIDGQGRTVYNAATSVQPKWLNPEIIEITQRTLKKLGVAFSSQDFQNYGASVIATGN